MNGEQITLLGQVTKDETSRSNYQDENISTDLFTSEFEESLSTILSVETPTEVKVEPVKDVFTYNTEDNHISFEKSAFAKLLSQLVPIIDLGSKRVVARGITLLTHGNTVDLISPNEMFYFKGELNCECTLPNETHIFLDFRFLSKMLKFMPPKVSIYQKVDEASGVKYYLQLTTGDLELVNTQLLNNDLKALSYEFNITDLNKEIEPSELLATLNPFSRLVNFESDVKRKQAKISEKGDMTFMSPLLMAYTKSELPNSAIGLKVINYLIKAANSLNSGSKIRVLNVDSPQYKRYAFQTDNTVMIAAYAEPKEELQLLNLLNSKPQMVKFNLEDLKYELDYANSITYALGVILFTYKDGKLNGEIKLNNGSTSPFNIELYSDISLAEGTTFKVNTKTFFNALNTLDTGAESTIGFNEGFLFIDNASLSLMLLTI